MFVCLFECLCSVCVSVRVSIVTPLTLSPLISLTLSPPHSSVWRVVTDTFDYLTLASVIENRIFCVHGGLGKGKDDMPLSIDKVHSPHSYAHTHIHSHTFHKRTHTLSCNLGKRTQARTHKTYRHKPILSLLHTHTHTRIWTDQGAGQEDGGAARRADV